jgi:hypothetical protein
VVLLVGIVLMLAEALHLLSPWVAVVSVVGVIVLLLVAAILMRRAEPILKSRVIETLGWRLIRCCVRVAATSVTPRTEPSDANVLRFGSEYDVRLAFARHNRNGTRGAGGFSQSNSLRFVNHLPA